jgi:hypothetical protein
MTPCGETIAAAKFACTWIVDQPSLPPYGATSDAGHWMKLGDLAEASALLLGDVVAAIRSKPTAIKSPKISFAWIFILISSFYNYQG